MILIATTWRNVCGLHVRRLQSLASPRPLVQAAAFAAPLHRRCTTSRTITVSSGHRTISAAPAAPELHRSLISNRRRRSMMSTTSAATSTAAEAAAASPAPADAAPAPPSGLTDQPAGMDSEAALLAAFSEVPVLSRGVVRPAAGGGVTITATLQQRNLPANAQRRYTITAALPAAGASGAGGEALAALVGMPQELSADVQLISVSPSGSQQLVVLKGPNEATAVLLQLWRGARMAAELAVPKTLHGPLVNDGYFASGAAWTADESAVVYCAETAPLERTPAWCGPESLKEGAGPRSWRGVGASVEDWGELNTGKRPPAPYVFDVARKVVVKVPGLPAEHSVGQPAWCPPQPAASTTHGSEDPAAAPAVTSSSTGGGPSGLVVVAWPHAPPPSYPRLAAAASARKLGIVFCYNRCAHLYHIPVQRGADGTLQFGPAAARLCPSLESGMSPTFNPAGDALVFVSHAEAVATGTHGATGRLYRMDWSPEAAAPSSPEPQLLVDVVDRPAGPSAFPGLYTASIPDEGFVGPNTLLLNTQWGAVSVIAAINTADAGALPTPLTPVDSDAARYGNWTLLGVAGGLVVASRAAPACPAEILVARLPDDPAALTTAGLGPLSWQPLELGAPGGGGGMRSELPAAVQETLDKLDFQVMGVNPRLGDCSSPFDSLVWLPKDRQGPLPAVLAPHGGPHTAVLMGWYPAYAFMVALGYVVISPNYRGSTGYGQRALASLPGAAGRQDVDDCMAAVEAAVAAGLVDPSRVSVVGGSHGGFLTAHLLGQHPGAFRSGVLRNPVTNISAMVAATDIPDWCYVEVFGSEEGRRRCSPVPTPADLAAMYDASPVVHVDHVTAPTFLMLGAKDRRVPPPDGLQYLTALKGRDVAAAGPPPITRLIVFPEDAHGLDKPQTEFEQWVNVAWWLKTYSGLAEAPAAATAEEAAS